MNKANKISQFARVNYRHYDKPFGIKQADRLLHTYIIGKTGTGKSTLLQTLMLQDIKHQRGFMLLDVHGDLVRRIYKEVPFYQKKDVIYINLPDSKMPYRYNPLRKVSPAKRSLVASGILEVFQKLFGSAWGVRMEHILRYVLLTLLDQPSATTQDISRIIHDESFRNNCISNILNKNVRQFWLNEFPKFSKNDILPILSKLGSFLAHPIIKKVLVDNPTEISLRKAMDEKKIVLINLSKGHLGEDVAHILGSLFMTSLSAAAFSRIDTEEHSRIPFTVFCDEFQNFTNLSIVNMTSELRKFKIGLVFAHQYLHQLSEPIRKAILGNVGTIISFRIGLEDARHMKNEMFPVFDVEDFIKLENYHIYLKLMIDGKPSQPFSAVTIPPYEL